MHIKQRDANITEKGFATPNETKQEIQKLMIIFPSRSWDHAFSMKNDRLNKKCTTTRANA